MTGNGTAVIVKAVAVVAGITLLSVAPATSAEPRADVASIQHGDSLITWSPEGDHAGLVLTVSGPGGFYLRQEFISEEPAFSIFDREGQVLLDGLYKWQLTATPRLTAAQRRELLAARAVGEPPAVDGGTTSGAFSVRGGRFVTPTEEGPRPRGQGPTLAPRDFVIADDLIVQGSACIGLDCVNNENFGFDTIRLKENNLRIKFEDTSTTTGFPTRDWQLTANDSASGGLDKFSIDDITAGRTPFTVEGNADANSLYVDTGKRVGIGTNTPVLNLHVKTGNTPAVRLEQDNSSGFTPQTWDIAGNEANFFVRDVTGGSTLPFRIQPGAPSSAVFIAGTSGNLGVGTSSPGSALHVRRADGARTEIRVENANAAAQAAAYRMQNSARTWEFQADTVGNVLFRDVTQNSNPFVIEPAVANEVIRIDSGNGGRVGIRTGNNVNFTLEVNGTIGVTGVGQVHPDYVFEPDYELPSIEEHAAYMFEHKHLPAVGAGQYDTEGRAVIDLGGRSQGMLEELEKAHIYIAQINEAGKTKDRRIADLEERIANLEMQLRRAD